MQKPAKQQGRNLSTKLRDHIGDPLHSADEYFRRHHMSYGHFVLNSSYRPIYGVQIVYLCSVSLHKVRVTN